MMYNETPDLILLDMSDLAQPITPLIRPAHFVPETKLIGELLRDKGLKVSRIARGLRVRLIEYLAPCPAEVASNRLVDERARALERLRGREVGVDGPAEAEPPERRGAREPARRDRFVARYHPRPFSQRLPPCREYRICGAVGNVNVPGARLTPSEVRSYAEEPLYDPTDGDFPDDSHERSMIAPLGTRPAVGTPWVSCSAWPSALKPETKTEPCATA